MRKCRSRGRSVEVETAAHVGIIVTPMSADISAFLSSLLFLSLSLSLRSARPSNAANVRHLLFPEHVLPGAANGPDLLLIARSRSGQLQSPHRRPQHGGFYLQACFLPPDLRLYRAITKGRSYPLSTPGRSCKPICPLLEWRSLEGSR
jgi:hypothetical protein